MARPSESAWYSPDTRAPCTQHPEQGRGLSWGLATPLSSQEERAVRAAAAEPKAMWSALPKACLGREVDLEGHPP